MAFDHRVGGQRGGHRDQRNVLGRQALGKFGYRVSNGAGHANGQVALGGDRLGGRHDLVALGFDDGGVGVGAAGVYANKVTGLRRLRRVVHAQTRARARKKIEETKKKPQSGDFPLALFSPREAM